MDKGAEACGMDPMEFRILNAYRDGDMKAHRRIAKNTALIECVQVAAEKANWPLSENAKRQSSLTGGGGARAEIPATPIDHNGQINRPETRGGGPVQTLPAGTMRIPLTKQPIMEGTTDSRPKPAAVPQYEAYRPAPAQPPSASPPQPQRCRPRRLPRPPPRRSPSTARCASPPCSARGGADHGEASRARDGLGQLSHRHEPRRRSKQALIHSNPDGKFTVALSAIDLGQGMKQVTRQVAAETLGVPMEDVYVDTADSDTGPTTWEASLRAAPHRMGKRSHRRGEGGEGRAAGGGSGGA